MDQLVDLPDGAQLWATANGAGPPVIFCHGGPGLWDYLEPLATPIAAASYRTIRFEQRGCGRSTGAGPFTIAQALDDLDAVRQFFAGERIRIVGHSWGAELALRYAAAFSDHVESVVYLCGVGAGDDFRPAFAAEFARRLGHGAHRLRELDARSRTSAEERELCLLRWTCDFVPGPRARSYAEQFWTARPAGCEVNTRANRELWADRQTTDLLAIAAGVTCPVTMIAGVADPRPWGATDSLRNALRVVERTVLDGAGHQPWYELPGRTTDVVLRGLRGRNP